MYNRLHIHILSTSDGKALRHWDPENYLLSCNCFMNLSPGQERITCPLPQTAVGSRKSTPPHLLSHCHPPQLAVGSSEKVFLLTIFCPHPRGCKNSPLISHELT